MKITRSLTLGTVAILVCVFVAAPPFIFPSTTPAQPKLLSYWTCTPDYVAAFSNRVHAHCNPANGAIQWFAVCSTGSGSAFASRALSIFTTAKVTGKSLRVYYEPTDTSGTACGCDSANCRVITGAEVLP